VAGLRGGQLAGADHFHQRHRALPRRRQRRAVSLRDSERSEAGEPMKARGFTLLEMMISLGIASITALAVFGVLSGQLLGLNDQNRVADVQDNARLAMDTITAKLSTAGFGLPPAKVFGPTGDAGGGKTQAANNAAGGDAYNTCANTDVVEVHT